MTGVGAEERVADIWDRVQRGAELLDRKLPGWADQVAIGLLDMKSSCYCVLGQLYRDYFKALDKLSRADSDKMKEEEWADQHGFLALAYDPETGRERFDSCLEGDKRWRLLERYWKEVIADRKAARGRQ